MESKQKRVISVIALILLALTIIAATYAYFNAQNGDPTAADIKINANTVDTLTFATGNQISFTINQENFASGTGNQTSSTYASALLTANNKTNIATEHYYLYLNIENNTFTYSIDENTPEIIMTVTDTSGTKITDISTLTHVVATGADGKEVSGYDITNKNGLITLFNNREITATPSKEEKWNVKITFVNYDQNQKANAGMSMSAKLMIQKKEVKTLLADYVKSLYTGTQGDNGIYYHDSSLENGAGDNSYRYAGANESVNNFVCFGSTEVPCPTDNLYRIIGVFEDKVKLIKYDYANNNLLGTDGDYKGTGTPDASYYKESLTTINTYYWNYKNDTSINGGYGSNEWSTSLFNKTNLNTNYLKNIGTTWANVIEDTTWKVSGHSTYSVTPSVMFTAEITNATKTYGPSDGTSKIGLMYASDYGFAASPSAWTQALNKYNSSTVTAVNWMYMGFNEWTISPRSSGRGYVFGLGSNGYLSIYNANSGRGARPVLYLKASVAYAGGSGTKDSPITLGV